MNTVIYLKDVPLFKKILGFALSFFGLFAFLFLNIIMGAIFLVLGINLLMTEGSEINLQNNTSNPEKKAIAARHIYRGIGEIFLGPFLLIPDIVQTIRDYRTVKDYKINCIFSKISVSL